MCIREEGRKEGGGRMGIEVYHAVPVVLDSEEQLSKCL